ncbi:hypothetical protein [Actinophytocola oryzae]|uniref:hypothetical protein n=1 Tax=Actinophytocola oryzae TaxID=502181 RepID=UPI001414D883|nr:hypothetical protein [Actinophytocola oryzae]
MTQRAAQRRTVKLAQAGEGDTIKVDQLGLEAWFGIRRYRNHAAFPSAQGLA